MNDIQVNDNNYIIINNVNNYNIQIVDNTIIFKPKIKYITKDKIRDISLNGSTVLSCNIVDTQSNNIDIHKLNYNHILTQIWYKMPIQLLLKETTFNYKLGNQNKINGYLYDDNLQFSYQRKDATNTMKEIIKMIELNHFKLDIKIKLKNNNIIHFKI